ncbi:MAG: S-methyl-5'-thioadenosine phosphorylase, partial [Rhodobacteraceae bacterium]|nr:S-methyl-5'-thioadenosine phosphorylase [Paracoccaceae bacterium]
MTEPMIGIIGGSGVYQIEGLEDAGWRSVATPWGPPSDQILTGRLGGVAMAFLPRHGRGHVHSPSEVPFRANIDALKRLGVTDVVAVSACGSFREGMAPGDFVIVDQYIDRTFARAKSFFGTGCVAHVSLAHPTCARLSGAAAEAARATGVTVHEGGTYLAMEGPQFSTLAESRMYREHWGADVIGMTGMPEAKLAREAELCYASVAMVTDYDCWHPGHDAVDVAAVIRTLT